MGSLTNCAKQLGKALDPDDFNAIRKIAANYRKNGMDRQKAVIRATEDVIDDAIDERNDIARQILNAGGQADLMDIDSFLPSEAKQGEAKQSEAKKEEAKPAQITEKPGVAKAEKPERIEDFGEKIGGARKDTAGQLGKRTISKAKDQRPGWARRYHVMQIAKEGTRGRKTGNEGKWSIVDERSGRPLRHYFDTEQEALDAIPMVEVARNHSVRLSQKTSEDAPQQYEIVRNVTNRKRVVIKDGFNSREEAMTYMAKHAVEIIETKTRFDDSIHPVLEQAIREGEQRRKDGRNVVPKDFQEVFGFRGVEFGKWNNSAERQHILNQAYDAFLDLAEILQVPPKAISLNGELAIGFGSRGHGLTGAKAHYERSYGVINITKIKGAGSLAHEWMHAFDHYLGRQAEKAKSEKITNERGDKVYPAASAAGSDYVSHGFGWKSKDKVREELRKAFDHVINTIMQRDQEYTEDSSTRERIERRQQDELEKRLKDFRAELEKDYSNENWKPYRGKKNNQPATAEQLKRADALIAKIIKGDVGKEITPPTKGRFSYFSFHEPVFELSKLYKEIRGRQGYGRQSERRYGPIWDIEVAVDKRESAKTFLAEAKEQKAKTKKVATEYYSQAWRLDQGGVKDYWSTPHEMVARAFEAWVYDRLKGINARNDFLSYEKHNDLPEYRLFGVKPYPEGAERKAIDQAFDELFNVIRTKETERGVAMFSLRQSKTSNTGREGKLYSGYERETGKIREPGEVEQLSFDLEHAAEVPEKAIGASNFLTRYKPVEVGQVKTAYKIITEPEEAAHVLAKFRKNAQETLVALVLDDKYEPLAIIRHSIGTKDESSVYPGVLAGAIAGTDGAHSVWIAHNHPSGNPEPSRADYQITEKIHEALDGTDIALNGHIVLGAGRKAYYFTNSGYSRPIMILGGVRKGTIPITERVMRKAPPADRQVIGSPDTAKQILDGIEQKNALLLLDNRHRVIGSLALSAIEMRQLRTDGRAKRVLRAIDETNAAAAIIKSEDHKAASNLAKFLNKGEKVRVLDAVIYDQENPEGWSSASRGMGIEDSQGSFFALSEPNNTPSLGKDAVERIVDDVSRKFRLRPRLKFDTVATETDLPQDIQDDAARYGATGQVKAVYANGAVHLVADQFTNELEVEEAIWHEALGHYGARKLWGPNLDAVYRRLYTKLGGKEGILDLAEKQGFSLEDYTEGAEDMDPIHQQLLLVDEALAHIQGKQVYESLPKRTLRLIKQFWGALRARLARLGLIRMSKLSDSDLAYTLYRMRKAASSDVHTDGGIAFMVAWHGGPHDFDKFSTEHIGAGEGNQAYGWGLYFSSKKDVAEWYKESLGRTHVTVKGSADFSRLTDGKSNPFVGEAVMDLAMVAPDDFNETRDFIVRGFKRTVEADRRDGAKPGNSEELLLEEAIRVIGSLKKGDVKLESGGRLYQVELAPKEDEYLLWDKPLSEQSEKVRNALDELPRYLDMDIPSHLNLVDQIDHPPGGVELDGGSLIKELEFAFRGYSLKMMGRGGGRSATEAARHTSEVLHSLGIRGIKYLDGSSRGKGEGDYNYVIFSDDDVAIKAKFMFAGKRSKTANQYALSAAQEMVKQGADPERVRQTTGWFIGDDGKWRYEISDKDAKQSLSKLAEDAVKKGETVTVPLSEVLDHPKLFAAYPDVADVRVTLEKGKKGGSIYGDDIEVGYTDGKVNLTSLIHEIQHAIQYRESFATGGNPKIFKEFREKTNGLFKDVAKLDEASGFNDWLKNASDKELKKYERKNGLVDLDAAREAFARSHLKESSAEKYLNKIKEADEIYKKNLKKIGGTDTRSMSDVEAYLRLSSEVEARNTAARMGLSDEERRILPPKTTADRSDVIVMFNGKEALNMPPPANSRTGNQGTFDSSNPDIRFSLKNMESKTNELREGIVERAKHALNDYVETNYSKFLGTLTLRQLAEVGHDLLPQLDRMVEGMERMETARNRMVGEAMVLADRWRKLPFEVLEKLADLMHKATIAGIDPSESYTPEVDVKESKKRLSQIIKALRDNPSDKELQRELKELAGKVYQEKARQEKLLELKAEWESLPEEGKSIYIAARDEYTRMLDRMEAAILDRIDRAEIAKNVKTAAKYKVRQEFEKARAEKPYFPLARFGEFYVSAHRGEGTDREHAFFMFDTIGQRRRALKDIEREGWTITRQGKKSELQKDVEAVSESFVVDVVKELKNKMGDDLGKEAADVVYQSFLKSMPYLSNRVHFIHRKKTPGFSRDALRAYAFNMSHLANQIAHIEVMPDFAEAMKDMKDHIDQKAKTSENGDVTKEEALAEEARKAYEWMMSPEGSPWTAYATSLGFVFYLGMSPASALVNISQTAIVALPELAAEYTLPKAAYELNKAAASVIAARRFLKNRGDYSRWKTLTEDERKAFHTWRDLGTIEETQTHMLMGMSETESTRYNPSAAKAMEIVGFLFQEAEVINRETTLLAAYRLARKAGKSHAEAVKSAEIATYNSHFDYGNFNRARWMRNNWAKVLLLFRSYSQHMTYYLGRNFYQSIKGESPEVKRIARKRFIGVLGMTGVFSGTMGMPMIGMIFGIINALHSLFNDDDDKPWDAETEFRNFLADYGILGRIVDRGVVNAITGQNWSSRTSLNELWFRSPDRDLSGREMYAYWLEQFAGPVPGIGANWFRSADLWSEGHYERAVETALPKAIKDALRTIRYASEGVKTLKGDDVIPKDELGLWDLFSQAIGFTPDKVAAQWDANNQAKKYERRILDRRRELLKAFSLAYFANDEKMKQLALQKMQKFNIKNPTMMIGPKERRQSIRSRARYRLESIHGINLKKSLRGLTEKTRVPQ